MVMFSQLYSVYEFVFMCVCVSVWIKKALAELQELKFKAAQ